MYLLVDSEIIKLKQSISDCMVILYTIQCIGLVNVFLNILYSYYYIAHAWSLIWLSVLQLGYSEKKGRPLFLQFWSMFLNESCCQYDISNHNQILNNGDVYGQLDFLCGHGSGCIIVPLLHSSYNCKEITSICLIIIIKLWSLLLLHNFFQLKNS